MNEKKPLITPLHQGISVPDMDASIRWYRDVFEFEPISDDTEPMLNCRVVFLKSGAFELELFQYLGEDGKGLPPERRIPNEDLKTCGTKHVAYAVENMEAMLARLAEHKVEVAAGPFSMHGNAVCFIRDNSGILIELIQKNAYPEG